MSNWRLYEGLFVQGWLLESFGGERAGTPWFRGHNGIGLKSSQVLMLPAEAAGAGSVLSRWRVAKKLPHDNLLRIRECGEATIDERADVVYLVTELPDQDVAAILAGGPFTADDAATLLLALAGAVQRLHSNGVAHGAVCLSNAVIAEDTYKLAIGTLTPASREAQDTDIRQLGRTIVHAVTGDADAPFTPDSEAYARLHPLSRDVVMACLTRSSAQNWTADALLESLYAGFVPPLEAQPATNAPPPSQTAPARFPQLDWARMSMATAVSILVLLIQSSLMTQRAPAEPNQPVKPAQIVTARAVAAAEAPQRRPPEVAERAATPLLPEPKPVVALAPVAQEGTDERVRSVIPSGPSWAVVVGSYSSYAAARNHARRIKKRWPRATVAVVNNGSLHSVMIRSVVSRRDAERLERAARQTGLAEDAYVMQVRQTPASE